MNDPTIEAQAERWFARLLAPDCSARDRTEFEQWRQLPAHASAYDRCRSLWDRMGGADAVTDPRLLAMRERTRLRTGQATPSGNTGWDDAMATMPARRPRVHPPRIRRAWSLAIAASGLLLAVLLGVRFVSTPAAEAVYAATNELREIRLEDGTRVRLDVSSELSVVYDASSRAVTLRRGRAMFDVAHDAGRPFTVDLGQSRVTVLGTLFQAVRSEGNVSVTLGRGSLRLDGGSGSARSELLVPGEQVGYQVADASAWHKRSVDSAATLAWSRGRLVFRSTSLSEAVQEVNRYANPKIRLSDPALGELKVSGNFIAGDSELVASTWTATLPLRLENRGGEILLLPEKK